MEARQTQADVRSQNVTAAMAVANIVKSSLGPVGLDKMMVDDVGETTVTNDGATILKLLEVQHPAAKVLVELAQMQDKEVGDGTTSVVIFAAELLKRANELVKRKIHPTSIISGYRIAAKEAVKYINGTLGVASEKLGRDVLLNAAKTSLSSKILNTDLPFFAQMCVDSVQHVRSVNGQGEVRYPVKAINILKAHGQSSRQSQFISGYALNNTRSSQQMPSFVNGAKIALLDIDLRKFKLALGVQVVISDPKQLQAIQDRESDITKERIEKILSAGANVILTTKGIDEMAMKYFVEKGCLAIRRVAKEDMRRLAKCTGGNIILSLANMEGDEAFDPKDLGHADAIREVRVGDSEMTIFEGTKNYRSGSILLRGANSYMLDEMERSLHDSLCVVKRVLESGKVVPGGGCVETAVSVRLENFAVQMASREQMAVLEFSESLLIIPKVLAVNAAKDATELVANLRANHYIAQHSPEQQHVQHCGLELVEGSVRNNFEAGVLEPAMSKVKIIQFATEAAITILRIDDMIKLEKMEEEQ